MSGGSYNYNYNTIEWEYVGKMYDSVLNQMMKDLVKVLHDLEWWRSCDIGEEDYRKTANEFKEKWIFHGDNELCRQIIIEEFEKKRDELLKEFDCEK